MAGTIVSKAGAALKAWMDQKGITQAELARDLTEKLASAPGRSEKAINQSTISSWTRGAFTPSGLAMVALHEITEGAVQIADWLIPAPVESSPTLATGT